jgi:hypothetical protein
MQFGAVLGYVGHAAGWDEEIVNGDIEGRNFILYYLRDGRLLAAAAMGRDRQLNALHQLMAREQEPSVDDLANRDLDLTTFLRP